MRASASLRNILASAFALSLVACYPATRSTLEGASVKLAGKVHGGQQPVSGATIQLYAAGTSADGSLGTPLLLVPVVSDANGAFGLTLDYVCPAANPQVYLTATGGNPGLAFGTSNKASAMMTALGACNSLGSSTYISVNELTTVGAVAALYPYATGYANIGSGTSDSAQLPAAFTTTSEYVNPTTGTVPGPALPAGFYASSTEISTLADILSVCINSAGGTANDGSTCGNLFALTKPAGGVAPTDTLGAAINILKNPTMNVLSLFAIGSAAGAPFQPALSAAPSDWTLPILPIPAAPVFSLAGGTYLGPQSLTVIDATASATLYYTLDGSTPTTSSAIYSGSLVLSASKTVKVFASVSGRTSSAVVSAAYTINPLPASIVPVTGSGQSIQTGKVFATPLQVQVLDSSAKPVAGALVVFATSAGTAAATLSSTTCTTEASGLCLVTATANAAGGTYTVNASTNGLTAAFTLTNTGAHSYVVNVLTDTTTGVSANCIDQSSGSKAANTNCSLRDALSAAASATAALPATVTFAQTSASTITLSNGTLNLPSYTTLQGATSGGGASLANLITIDGNNAGTPFTAAASVTQAVFSNLVVINGNAGGSGNASLGGAILNLGTLTVNNSTFSGNSASASGGAISNYGGTLTVNGSTFVNNKAQSGYGGGIDNFSAGTLSIANSTFTGNSAPTSGGAIYNNGTTAVTTSTIVGNTSPYGAGIENRLNVSITDSIVNGNTSEDCGGVACEANWAYIVFSSATASVVDSNTITIAFRDTLGNSFSQSATYGPYSTPASVASVYGPYFYENFSGLDTTSITGQSFGTLLAISPLNGAMLNNFVITNPGKSFNAVLTSLPNPLVNNADVSGLTASQMNLGPLASNGGPTQTMLPLTGSAALCVLSPSAATGTDQRGQPRSVTVGAKNLPGRRCRSDQLLNASA